METLLNKLKIVPVPVLLSSTDEALVYLVKRDLLGENVMPIEYVWNLPAAQKIINKQQADGSWAFPGRKPVVYPPHHYKLVETFKQFRILIERYQFTKDNPAIGKAAEYLFSCQTTAGDIRGFIGNQYATYYTGAVLSLLIKAGYTNDTRVEKGLHWLLSMRQNDGGWTIPLLTHKFDRATIYRLTSQFAEPVEPDYSKPFSHNWTDMVLRAFAAHSRYRHSKEAKKAGTLLKSRFFQPDVYSSYRSASYWTRFQFWWPNLLTSLESLFSIGFTKDDPDIKVALNWFINHQVDDGLWYLSYNRPEKKINAKIILERQWLSYAICRMLKNG